MSKPSVLVSALTVRHREYGLLDMRIQRHSGKTPEEIVDEQREELDRLRAAAKNAAPA